MEFSIASLSATDPGAVAAAQQAAPVEVANASQVVTQPGTVEPSVRVSEPARNDLPSIREVQASSVPRSQNQIGNGILDRLDRIQARDLDRMNGAEGTEPVRIIDGTAPHAPAQSAFDAQMDMLQMTFDHALEVELAAKTGTGVSSSMNKLMSGS